MSRAAFVMLMGAAEKQFKDAFEAEDGDAIELPGEYEATAQGVLWLRCLPQHSLVTCPGRLDEHLLGASIS